MTDASVGHEQDAGAEGQHRRREEQTEWKGQAPRPLDAAVGGDPPGCGGPLADLGRRRAAG